MADLQRSAWVALDADNGSLHAFVQLYCDIWNKGRRDYVGDALIVREVD